MKRFTFAIVLALSWGAAFADDMVYRQGENVLRLLQAPCEPPVSEMYAATDVAKAAVAILGGQEFRGCWTAKDGIVHVRYEDGDQGRIRIQSFTRESGI